MKRKTQDYDDVFKTLKNKHKRLFIPVINEAFGKDYPQDAFVELVTSEGYLTGMENSEGKAKIRKRFSDFRMRIGNDVFLLECQSYDDGSMAIRIAEYSFLTALQSADWDAGHASLEMPHFAVIYIKGTEKTPKETVVTFRFPDGRVVDYGFQNVILKEFSKEYIIEKRLFAYIPFYVARYEREMERKGDLTGIIADLEYFRDEMTRLHAAGELTGSELVDLMKFVNILITHVTNGNEAEERLVKIMGGTVLETESERLFRIGREAGRKAGEETGKRLGVLEALGSLVKDGLLDIVEAARRAGMSLEQFQEYLN